MRRSASAWITREDRRAVPPLRSVGEHGRLWEVGGDRAVHFMVGMRYRRRVYPAIRSMLAVASVMLVALVAPAGAQVAVEGTRVVFPAASDEVTVSVRNGSDAPALVQAWIGDDDRRQAPEVSRAPFVLAPPLLRLDAGKDQKLRVRLVRKDAPQDDREHLYWLNLLAVPPQATAAADENILQVATRSRFKLLFRPAGMSPTLPPNFAESMGYAVRRGVTGRELVISNPTPYYFNIGRIVLAKNGVEHPLGNPYVSPFSERSLALPDVGGGSTVRIELSWLDDNGQLHAESKVVAQP